jgi:hypothetical protein
VNRLLGAGVALLGGLGTAAAIGLPASQATTAAQSVTGGQTLTVGQQLESPSGQYVLRLGATGNLQKAFNGGSGRVIWQTSGGAPGDDAVLQRNGNLVLDDSSGQTLWSANVTGTGCPSLDVQQDGNVVDYDPKAVWSTGAVHGLVGGDKLEPGWVVYAPGGLYYLIMQSDGNLVLYSDAPKALWSSGTSGHPGDYAYMQTDGNLVVYSSANKALWSSGTSGNAGATLDMQSDANLVVYSSAGKALWSSKTNGDANNGKDIDPNGPPGSATACPVPPPPPPPPPTTVTATVTTTTATVETVPEPAPRPRHVRIGVHVKWIYSGSTTRLGWMKISRLPRGTEFGVVYEQSYGHHRRHTRTAKTEKQLKSLVSWLKRYQYRAGDTVTLDISHRGYVAEKAKFTMRTAKLPRLTRG